jgi:hypothetical protein
MIIHSDRQRLFGEFPGVRVCEGCRKKGGSRKLSSIRLDTH